MGRPRKVEVGEVLDRALCLFWEKGYTGTSIDDLSEATGLQRGSLYALFPDKKTLFIETLKRYRDNIIETRWESVRSAPSSREGIQTFFELLIDCCMDQVPSRGCFITNTAVEMATADTEIREHIVNELSRWRAFWNHLFVQMRDEGALKEGQKPEDLTNYFYCLANGIAVLSKVEQNRQILVSVAEAGLAILD